MDEFAPERVEAVAKAICRSFVFGDNLDPELASYVDQNWSEYQLEARAALRADAAWQEAQQSKTVEPSPEEPKTVQPHPVECSPRNHW